METKTILIKDTTILNPNSNNVREFNGSVLIENDKIVKIDDKIDVSADKVIDGTNQFLMPGLVNTHNHISMNLFRGLADDLELDTWLNDNIWPMESHLNANYCYIGALFAAVEMIKSGTTTFNDMYFYMSSVAQAIDKAGIRGVLSYGMIDFEDAEKRENEFKENIDLIKDFNNTADGRITCRFGPHSTFTCSKELLERVREEANKYNVGIHIHMNETQKEINDVIEATGMRPFEYLDSLNFLDSDVLAAHCVWLSDNEINILKESNVQVSHNPCSNMKLASGISPVYKLINNDINVSIGTDGVASNNNLDLFEEMKFVSLLQKVNTLDPKVLPADEVFNMATINGAKALGLDNNIGSVEVGKKADLILLDKKSINMTPASNIPSSNIVYSANGSDVLTTICNGQILMENRKLTSLDEEKIMNLASEAIEEMKSL
ncbi:MAG: amidohydrolase family protein [Methanobacteriaceae archaeon]|nr:amidohydrolase family protein [Methanobacteriaceae archaeon]